MKFIKGAIVVIIIGGITGGIVTCLYVVGTGTLTTKESLLIGVLLTFASIIVTWLTTHLYSKLSLGELIKRETEHHTESIRNYAIKAAEKVLNLSNELQRLIDALNVALEEAEELPGYKDAVVVLQERMAAAIHNLRTLRSMNDTFLSDWRGVIGDEIKRQQELESQIEALSEEQKELRERLVWQLNSAEEIAAVERKIQETEQRLEGKIRALPFKVSKNSGKPGKQEILVDCSECGNAISTRLRTVKGAKKLLRCGECQAYSVVKQEADGTRRVKGIELQSFMVNCPVCTNSFTEELPDFPGALKTVECEQCGFPLVMSKTPSNINVKLAKGSRGKVSKKITEAVLELLPEQPWPKGIHKSIAGKLNISNNLVTRVVNTLITDGKITIMKSIDEGDSTGRKSEDENID